MVLLVETVIQQLGIGDLHHVSLYLTQVGKVKPAALMDGGGVRSWLRWQPFYGSKRRINP